MKQSTAKNKADTLFSQIIRGLGYCERCKRRPPEVRLETSHIFGRRYAAIRTDETNALCLCSACHRWWHDHPTETYEFAVSIIGVEAYERLRAKKNDMTGQRFDWITELDRLQSLPPISL
jgi:hypothetical protein